MNLQKENFRLNRKRFWKIFLNQKKEGKRGRDSLVNFQDSGLKPLVKENWFLFTMDNNNNNFVDGSVNSNNDTNNMNNNNNNMVTSTTEGMLIFLGVWGNIFSDCFSYIIFLSPFLFIIIIIIIIDFPSSSFFN